MFKKKININESNITSYFPELIEYLKKMGFDENNNIFASYSQILTNCTALNQSYTKSFEKAEKGEKSLDKDFVLNSIQTISKIVDACNDVINKTKGKDNLDELNYVSGAIKDLLAKDLKTLSTYNGETSLPELIQKGRSKIINITNKDISIVGAGLSTRMVIDHTFDGVTTKGVFTKGQKTDYDKATIDTFNKYTKAYPEYSPYLETVLESDIFNLGWEKTNYDKNGKPRLNNLAQNLYGISAKIRRIGT